MRQTVWCGVLMASLLLAGAAGGVEPAQKCGSAKLKEAGKYGFCRLKAEAKAVKKGMPPDYGKCLAKYDLKWPAVEAEGAGMCPSNGDQTAIEALISQHTSDLATALAGGPLPNCALDLAACSSDLATCGGSLAVATADLGTCNSTLATCDATLATVNAGTAVAAEVLSGVTFSSSAGIGISGAMANNGAVAIIPGTSAQAIPAGYHDGAGSVDGDADLVAGNIKSGVDLFGVAGTFGGGSGGVLKTGQTTAYGAGSDGALQLGASQTFVDNGDGTISDLTTGLMWEKKSDDGSIHDKDNTYTWSGATIPLMEGTMVTAFLAALNGGGGFAGHTDWRIPNVNELQSIRNLEASTPTTFTAFNTGCFAGCTVASLCSCTASIYWSSTTYQLIPGSALVVNFGGSSLVSASTKNQFYNVRAVRGGS